MSDSRQAVHELLDSLPKSELNAARRFLEFLRERGDPLAHLPHDDEPTTPAEDASCKEAWEEYKRGEYMAAEEAELELFE